MVLAALESPAFIRRLRDQNHAGKDLYDDIRQDEEELEALANDMGERRISREWMIARQPIEERLNRNRDKLAKVSRLAVLSGFVGTYEDMQGRWRKMRWDADRPVFDWIA